MEKFFTELSGAPVIANKENAPAGFISEIIINPSNGAVAGISLDQKFNNVVPAIDIRELGNPTIISTMDAISESDEIIKIKQILAENAKILYGKVFTKTGIYLGKVYDFAVNTNLLSLTKIAVAKSMLGLVRFDQILLPYTEIIEITPEKIIVNAGLSAKKIKVSAVDRVRAGRKIKACAEYE